jgi:hypothetical protein
MKKFMLLTLALFCIISHMEVSAQNRTEEILFAYFSWGGNTREIARQIFEALSVHRTGGRSLPNDISSWLRKAGISEK